MVMRRLRYALNLRTHELAKIIELAGYSIRIEELRPLLLREHEDGFIECSVDVLSYFLDGLILRLRGQLEVKPEDRPMPRVLADSNNVVMRKLRIAFNLREDETLRLLALGGFSMSAQELRAIFRRQGHKHYRECGDQVLRYFLSGLTKQQRPDLPGSDETEDTPVKQ